MINKTTGKTIVKFLFPALMMTVLFGVSGAAWPVDADQSTVKVYLVALGDNGKTGQKIGCEDSLVAVNRSVKSTGAPLKAALAELLAMPRQYNEQLNNFWGENSLKLKSVSVSKGVATIRLTGKGPSVAGVCDEPRIISQIEETAKQFPSVKRVKVFVNNESLAQAIR